MPVWLPRRARTDRHGSAASSDRAPSAPCPCAPSAVHRGPHPTDRRSFLASCPHRPLVVRCRRQSDVHVMCRASGIPAPTNATIALQTATGASRRRYSFEGRNLLQTIAPVNGCRRGLEAPIQRWRARSRRVSVAAPIRGMRDLPERAAIVLGRRRGRQAGAISAFSPPFDRQTLSIIGPDGFSAGLEPVRAGSCT